MIKAQPWRPAVAALSVLSQVIVLSGVFILTAAPAAAADTRLHDLQWNVCDQKGSVPPGSVCDWTPSQKAVEIERLIEAADWRANIVTLQEICQSTFNLLLPRLGFPWDGYFATTVTFPDDTRCRNTTTRNWGIAVIVKGDIYGYDNRYIGNDPDDGEVRRFLCGDVSIGRGQRVCTTHLTPSISTEARAENRTQFNTVRAQVNTWAVQNFATSLGADLNRDVRSCGSVDDLNILEDIYESDLGPSSCLHYGDRHYYETDRRSRGTGDIADEATIGSKKLDYFFVNYQRFYADYGGKLKATAYSDHKPLHAAVTIH